MMTKNNDSVDTFHDHELDQLKALQCQQSRLLSAAVPVNNDSQQMS